MSADEREKNNKIRGKANKFDLNQSTTAELEKYAGHNREQKDTKPIANIATPVFFAL